MAQSVKRLTLAQVMLSRFMGSSPALGSVLTARSLEPALDSVSPRSLPAPPLLTLCLSLKNKHERKLKNKTKRKPTDEEEHFVTCTFAYYSPSLSIAHILNPTMNTKAMPRFALG